MTSSSSRGTRTAGLPRWPSPRWPNETTSPPTGPSGRSRHVRRPSYCGMTSAQARSASPGGRSGPSWPKSTDFPTMRWSTSSRRASSRARRSTSTFRGPRQGAVRARRGRRRRVRRPLRPRARRERSSPPSRSGARGAPHRLRPRVVAAFDHPPALLAGRRRELVELVLPRRCARRRAARSSSSGSTVSGRPRL